MWSPEVRVSVARIACSLTAIAALVLAPLPAGAETLYLKNGTQVKGKIVKEDLKSFSVDTPDGRRKILKEELEVLSTADPVVTAVLGLVPGAGHIYLGDFPRAGLFLGLGAGAGFGAFKVAEQIRPLSPSTHTVAAIVAIEVIALLGGWDALQQALEQRQRVRYRVDYAE